VRRPPRDAEPEHLDAYLDEFVFRFNRRSSASRGMLFYRLLQQAVVTDPVTYQNIAGQTREAAVPTDIGNVGT
jgi:hypothetical protein